MAKEFEKLNLEVVIPPTRATLRITVLKIQLTLRGRIKDAQGNGPFFRKIKTEIGTSKRKGFAMMTMPCYSREGYVYQMMKG